MKVAFLFLHPLSGSLGSTVRVRELTTSLNRFGTQTLVLSPYEADHIMEGGVSVKSIPTLASRLGLSGVVYRLSRFAYYNKIAARNLLTKGKLLKLLADGVSNGAHEVLKNDCVDVLQAEQDVAIMPALKLAEKTGSFVVADLHNIMAEELVAAGVISREDDEYKALQQQLADALGQVDLTVAVSEQMKAYVHSEYDIANGSICVVPPGGRPRIMCVEERPMPPKAVFAGLVSYREHVDLFVESMPMVSEKRSDTMFYVTKKGDDLKRIEKMAGRLRVSPEYFWYPSEKQFYEFLASCHVGVLPSTSDVARRLGTPAKLFAYLSVGLPVVANDVGGWTDIIRHENVGTLTEDSPQSFASAILELLDDADLRLNFMHRGLEAIKTKYSWDNSAKTLQSQYEHLLGS